MIENYTKTAEVGDKVKVVVKREVKGKIKEKKLKAKAIAIEREEKYFLQKNDQATAEQLAIRKAWLKAR